MTTKRAVIEAMLCGDAPTLITVDGRSCDVPKQYRDCAHLVLRIGRNLMPPVEVEYWRDDSLIAWLDFKGESYRCAVPWGALYAAMFEANPSSQVVWPASLPRTGVAPAPAPTPRGHLKVCP